MSTDLLEGMTLLDFIRYEQRLTGTKIGCREGDCGACTVLVGSMKDDKLQYQAMTSCLLPLANAAGKHIVTIEGINLPGKLNPIQQAMADEGATQCGFCTPGFVMSLAGYCLDHDPPSKERAIAAIDGNICRCTGYKSIIRAAEKITSSLNERNGEEPAVFASQQQILPGYFANIKSQLSLPANGIGTNEQPETIVGGGTDLYVQRHEEMVHAKSSFVFDDSRLNRIVQEGNKLILGAAVTVSDLLRSSLFNKLFPEFSKHAKLISSTPIRNMATIAGNFINASPIGDLTIFFLALDAQVHLGGGDKKRTVPLRKLYKGYKQLDKLPGEIVESISFNIPGKDRFFSFEKVSKRTHLDIASVNTALYLEVNGKIISEARVSAGGVAPIPLFLEKTSDFLKGKELSEELIESAIEIAKTEIAPISDARGSKEYKTLLLGQLIRVHFMNISKKLSP